MKYTKLNYFASQSSHTHFVYLAQGAAETVYLQFLFSLQPRTSPPNILSGEQLQ